MSRRSPVCLPGGAASLDGEIVQTLFGDAHGGFHFGDRGLRLSCFASSRGLCAQKMARSKCSETRE